MSTLDFNPIQAYASRMPPMPDAVVTVRIYPETLVNAIRAAFHRMPLPVIEFVTSKRIRELEEAIAREHFNMLRTAALRTSLIERLKSNVQELRRATDAEADARTRSLERLRNLSMWREH